MLETLEISEEELKKAIDTLRSEGADAPDEALVHIAIQRVVADKTNTFQSAEKRSAIFLGMTKGSERMTKKRNEKIALFKQKQNIPDTSLPAAKQVGDEIIPLKYRYLCKVDGNENCAEHPGELEIEEREESWYVSELQVVLMEEVRPEMLTEEQKRKKIKELPVIVNISVDGELEEGGKFADLLREEIMGLTGGKVCQLEIPMFKNDQQEYRIPRKLGEITKTDREIKSTNGLIKASRGFTSYRELHNLGESGQLADDTFAVTNGIITQIFKGKNSGYNIVLKDEDIINGRDLPTFMVWQRERPQYGVGSAVTIVGRANWTQDRSNVMIFANNIIGIANRSFVLKNENIKSATEIGNKIGGVTLQEATKEEKGDLGL